MVELSRDADGRTRARLLDLVPGRSGETHRSWLQDRGDAFRARVEIAALGRFHGYEEALDDQLEDAVAVLDAFRVVKLATAVVDDGRRRVREEDIGHRAAGTTRSADRSILRAAAERTSPTPIGEADRGVHRR